MCWERQKEVMEVYDEGCERIEKNSDWVRTMKNIEHMKEALRLKGILNP